MENNKFIEFIDQKISEYKESLEETQNELSKSIRDRYPLQKIMIQEMYYKKWLEDIKNSENPKKMIETCLDMFERQRERFEEIKSSWKELEDFSKIEFPDENEDEDFIKILIDAKMLINTDGQVHYYAQKKPGIYIRFFLFEKSNYPFGLGSLLHW